MASGTEYQVTGSAEVTFPVRLTEVPLQTVCDDDERTGGFGELITVMAEVAVAVQPLISDPVTV